MWHENTGFHSVLLISLKSELVKQTSSKGSKNIIFLIANKLYSIGQHIIKNEHLRSAILKIGFVLRIIINFKFLIKTIIIHKLNTFNTKSIANHINCSSINATSNTVRLHSVTNEPLCNVPSALQKIY